MKRFRILIVIVFMFLGVNPTPAFSAEGQKVSPDVPAKDVYAEKTPNVEVVADSLEYLKQEKKVIAKKNVVISYQDMKITADYAEVETETKRAYARGHVIVFRDDQPVARGEEATYNFLTHQGSFPNAKAISFPWYGAGEDIQQVR
ncbi:MAG TPA: LptA/OstA family protein, partial [bacterium]|nr:LptA/OstA family protein [bacterium]